jgi:hypothetical protein
VIGIARLGGGSPCPAIDLARTRPVAVTTPLDPGRQVAIEWGNQRWPGTVVSLLPDGRVRVHDLAYAASQDEVVPRTRLQAFWARPRAVGDSPQATPPSVLRGRETRRSQGRRCASKKARMRALPSKSREMRPAAAE